MCVCVCVYVCMYECVSFLEERKVTQSKVHVYTYYIYLYSRRVFGRQPSQAEGDPETCTGAAWRGASVRLVMQEARIRRE